MKSNRTTEIKVGIVTITGILLFIIGISLGRGFHLTVAQPEIKLRFSNSGGIQESAPIFVNGVKRGIVKTIKNNDGSVLINAVIDKTDDLREDVTARISILEITGGKKIDIFPGTSQNSFNPGNEIPGTNAADFSELAAILGDIGNDAASLVRRLDTISYLTVELLSNKNIIDNLKSSIKNTSELTQNLNSFVSKNMASLESSVANLKILTDDLKSAIKKNEPLVENILIKIESTLSDVKSLIDKSNNTIIKADVALTNINEIADTLKFGSGLIPRLMSDRNLSENIDSTLITLNKLIQHIRKYGINANVSLGRKP